MTETPLLEMRNINKSFGPVHVLHDVDFSVYEGQVTALVGDNGAGKSTLVKCLAGIHQIDTGEILFDGQHVTIHGPRDAAELGIEIVYQDLALADNLDIVQNMFLGREAARAGGLALNEGFMEKEARRALASLSVRTISQRGRRWQACPVVSGRAWPLRRPCCGIAGSWCWMSPRQPSA